MHIEIQGPQDILEGFKLSLHHELHKAGFSDGPKIISADRKVIGYTKGDAILNIEISEESERGQSRLMVECESEIPGFQNIWDAALIAYGKEIVNRIQNFAIDKEKVKREF